MKETLNYKLKKPEHNDIVNVDDFNYNADIMDKELKRIDDKTSNITVGDIKFSDGKTVEEKFTEVDNNISAKETPQASQEKANKALDAAKSYTDEVAVTLADDLESHKADNVAHRQKQIGKWIDTSTVILPQNEYIKRIPLSIEARSGKLFVKEGSSYGGIVFFTKDPGDAIGYIGDRKFNIDGGNLAAVGEVSTTYPVYLTSVYIENNYLVLKIFNNHTSNNAKLGINFMYWEVEG